MCGIAGSYAYDPRAARVDVDELSRAAARMSCRGPDGHGLWLDHARRLGCAHRRLAIIDLSEGGAQPMRSPAGRFVVTINGEIYNYRALRERLRAEGCRFSSESDREVLLQLYARRGSDMVVSALETSWYMRNQLLRDNDWSSMSHSLEVRLPFVNWTLWRRVSRIAARGQLFGKLAMASTPARPLHAEALPRSKTGFLIPTQAWMTARTEKLGLRRNIRGWAVTVYWAQTGLAV